jgi:hypothetical protein
MQALTISPTARSLAFAHHANRRQGSSIAGPASLLAAIVLLLAILPSLAGGDSPTRMAAPEPLPAPAPAVVAGS